MTVLVRRPGVRKTRKNALCMRYSAFCWRACALKHKYAEKNGKTLRRESAQGGHLFTICARFADVCMVLQNVKGLGLFCGA